MPGPLSCPTTRSAMRDPSKETTILSTLGQGLVMCLGVLRSLHFYSPQAFTSVRMPPFLQHCIWAPR